MWCYCWRAVPGQTLFLSTNIWFDCGELAVIIHIFPLLREPPRRDKKNPPQWQCLPSALITQQLQRCVCTQIQSAALPLALETGRFIWVPEEERKTLVVWPRANEAADTFCILPPSAQWPLRCWLFIKKRFDWWFRDWSSSPIVSHLKGNRVMAGQTSALFWVFSKDCTMRRAVRGFSRVLHRMITVSFWRVSFIVALPMYHSAPVNHLNIHFQCAASTNDRTRLNFQAALPDKSSSLSHRSRMRISLTGTVPLLHLMPLVYYWLNFKMPAHLPTLGQTCYTRETVLLAEHELTLDSSLEVITLSEKCTKTEELAKENWA